MKLIVAAVIERSDRRILIGQRRREDTSPLKWEFPGGKIEEGETPEAALARELQEELSVTLEKCAEMARARHKYPSMSEELEIRFYAASIKESKITPNEFEQIAWALPKELGDYDFLAANSQLIGQLATGRLRPSEILERATNFPQNRKSEP
jgi:8-oxo-dGTP diphosphatase